MAALHEDLHEYRKQLAQGAIQRAYKGLMDYLLALRTHFQHSYPAYAVSGNLYYGYMDMTYFSVVPASFKQRQLKIAIVFLHEAFRFEVWLAGYNKRVQTAYWKLFQERDWKTYPLVSTPKGVDAIIESVVVDHPDFRDLETLTKHIEQGTLQFIQDVESFLVAQEL